MSRLRSLFLLAPAFLVATPAHGSQTDNMPWDNILQTLADSATGTVTSALVTIGIVVGGIYWFLSDSQRGLVNILKAIVVAGIITGITAFLGAFGISMATI